MRVLAEFGRTFDEAFGRRLSHNLIDVPAYREQIDRLRHQLFAELQESGALDVPFRPPAGERLDQRKNR